MTDIQTPEDWWKIFNTHFGNIRDEIVPRVYGTHSKGVKTQEALDKLKESKDHHGLVILLNDIWADAPDKGYIHSWPSWGVLCELCSEAWVFGEE